jgi:hypothetical protein
MVGAADDPAEPARLHLVRDDAEASLCGVARSSLGSLQVSSEIVCPDCIAWLPKRLALSDRFPRAQPA